MQFHLNSEERNVLLEILARHATARSNALFEQLMDHDLRLGCDELEDLSEILTVESGKLQERMGTDPTVAGRLELRQKWQLLQGVRDKVTECLAMV